MVNTHEYKPLCTIHEYEYKPLCTIHEYEYKRVCSIHDSEYVFKLLLPQWRHLGRGHGPCMHAMRARGLPSAVGVARWRGVD